MPHQIKCLYKLGDKIKANSPVTYNEGFFEKDFYDPNNIVLKNGVIATVALIEDDNNNEDSSIITTNLANKLSTKLTFVRNIIVDFKQNVHNLVKINDTVTPDSILCIIEDSVSSSIDVFNEQSLKLLEKIGGQAPKSKYTGVVDHIEIFYDGSIEDMSPSLAKLTKESNKLMASKQNKDPEEFNGGVNYGFKVDGNALELDTLVIRVYITKNNEPSYGDKGVLSNQLKTVFSKILDKPPITEDGTEIDMIFSNISVFNRIVASVFDIGTTTSILDKLSTESAKIYFGEK